uniref:DUF5702 domain-containing protein n=1 Tax=Eubacterium cellulosolvens TaxID=29322 RepID=UPI000486FA03|nr:DUF5702 domain-containing protein [[Eubacterium] cellulosolvens]
MYWKKGQRGAVSVFLTLVLVPVLIFACLTTDVAKICSAKVVISDSGELAMNAALAQYDETLFDQYGLLAMSKTPESMERELESFFCGTLSSSGIPEASGYEEILGLVNENFHAFHVNHTEVYRTEVEKQQILEYMKYRAPVCLTELVLKKLGFIKDNKKLLDAMNKEMNFAESMEECQDAFDEALKALDKLNNTIEAFPSQQDLEDALAGTQRDFTTTVARCLLMSAAIQDYEDKPEHRTLEQMMESYIAEANKVDLNDPYSESSYENYLDATYYDNGITEAERVKSLKESESKETDSKESESKDAESEESEAKGSKLKDEYNKAKKRVSGYLNSLSGTASGLVANSYNTLNGHYNFASAAASQAKTAGDKLETVRKKIVQAIKEYDRWDTATQALSEEMRGDMDDEVEEYRNFFSDDLDNLKLLQTYVKDDKDYFEEIKKILTEEKEYSTPIATTATSSQISTYKSKASKAVSGKVKEYATIEQIRSESFVTHYHHADTTTQNMMYRIDSDPFYLRLQDYCKKKETEPSKKSKEESDKANRNFEKGAEGAKDAKDDTGYPSYDWKSASQMLPSEKLKSNSSTQASSTLTNLGSGNDVANKESRKDIISKMKDSINEAQNFLDGLDRIIENNLENLYIAEYAMQMFSYYTCDKKMQTDKMVQTLSEDENCSISGYKLSKNTAYKAEVEYILWGNSSSKKNVQSTVMLLFGVRLLINSIFAFTDRDINISTTIAASAMSGGVPFLEAIIKVALKFALAAGETAIDIQRLKEGAGVVIFKDKTTFQMQPAGVLENADVRGSKKNNLTLDYGEYLRIFLNVQMLAGKENTVLARIGDCIQVNTGTDITEAYTMVEIEADVNVKTTFMKKIAGWSSKEREKESNWKYGDSYTVKYKSILGY